MIKNLTGGAVINYGPTLPTADSTYDGGMFYKNFGSDQGLYVFSFTQDANLGVLGDQVQQSWTQVQSPGLYVSKTGDTISGALGITGGGSTSDPYGRMSVTLPADSNAYGYFGLTRQGQVGWSIGVDSANRLFFGTGGAGTLNNVPNRVFSFGPDGSFQLSGGTVWHSGNDGLGSGLDAGLLGGQPPSFYSNAGNLTAGTLDAARLPYVAVRQGGSSTVTISWATSQLALNVDATNFGTTWPLNISGTAATANFATSATNATNAVEATSTRYVHSGGTVGGTAMTFTWSDPGGAPAYLWGGNSAGQQLVFQPINLSVGTAVNATFATNATNAVNATNATNLANFGVGGRSAADVNSYRTSGMYATESTPPNGVYPYAPVIVGSNSDVGLQISGGYNSDSLWFRGWSGSGAAFTPWRGVIHTGNISSQTVAVANNLVTNANLTGTTAFSRMIGDNGSAASPTYSFKSDGGTDTGMYWGGDGYLNFSSNSAYAGGFSPGGNFTAAGNITAFSDRRIKENIAVIPEALSKVLALSGVTYNRIDTGERGTGLIAQDVQAVLPEAVMTQEFDGMLSVAYGNLVGLLVESIKELSGQVESLKMDIEKLKGQ